MQLEDPRFLFVNVATGVACALFHAPLVAVLLVCSVIGVLTLPPFVLGRASGFWGSYRLSNFPVLKSILLSRSNVPADKVWVVMVALVLLACCAGVFGLVMSEALLPRVSGFEASGRPFAPVAITMLCLYALFRTLIWWARKKRIAV